MMQENPVRIGLLPLFMALYDECVPQHRTEIENFAASITAAFEERGIEVVRAPICRVKDEVKGAVDTFEAREVTAVVTLHLAYSPSLETSAVLAETNLPVIVLDTTPDAHFGPEQDPSRIFFNHGIHGVQDLCNVLIREGKFFGIEAGHWRESSVLDRVVQWINAASVLKGLREARVGVIGWPFEGMGDFAVPFETLAGEIGIRCVNWGENDATDLIPTQDSPEVAQELQRDRSEFDCSGIDSECHVRSVTAGLGVRNWIEENGLNAVTMNFLAFTSSLGFPTVPFLEVSRAMGGGIGYAGEGDVLTAAFVRALLAVFPETTFTEMFCPDWKGQRVFLSHMGEVNLALADIAPKLTEKAFPFTDCENPAVPGARLKSGRGTFVNLAPLQTGEYRLILADVDMCDCASDNMPEAIRGWMQPRMALESFLEQYSQYGGTHHGALVYGENICDTLEKMAHLKGWQSVRLTA